MKVRFILLVFLFCFLSGVSLLSAETTVESFLKEAPEGWAKLRKEYEKGYSSDCISSSGVPDTQKEDGFSSPKVSTSANELRLLGRNEISNFIDVDNDICYLTCINDSYGFNLTGKENKTIWRLRSMTENPSSLRRSDLGILQGCGPIFTGVMVELGWSDSLISSKDFKVISIQEEVSGQYNLVKVVFQSSHCVDKVNCILSGTLWLDKDHFWVIHQYKIDMQSSTKGTAHKKIYYRFIDDVPYPEKVINDYKFDGDPPIRYVTNYSSIKNNCEPSIFYLKNYGFSEPSKPPVSYSRFVLIVVGLLLIIVGLLMKFLSRKNNKS
jgi:hypothetical protein